MNEPIQLDPRHWKTALRWLDYDDQDLRLIGKIVHDTDLSSGAAFHCQQAAEKMAKAVLVAFGRDYPKTHELLELSEMVIAVQPKLGHLVGELRGLTDWYFAGRYPDLDYRPSSADIGQALAKLLELRRQIDSLAPKRGE